MKNSGKNAVVLLSGGLDSATSCAMAKNEGYNIYALTINYGQRHRAELEAAKRVAKHLGVTEHKTISVDLTQFGGSALTDASIPVPDYQSSTQIPITYVPARNTIFLSLAMAYAEVNNAQDIFIGASSLDYSGYPDCRPDYFEAFNQMANLATCAKIHTPLIYLSKAETLRQGMELGVDYSLTVSCYQANDQGEACGRCDSCYLRKKGFIDAELEDVTHYQPNCNT